MKYLETGIEVDGTFYPLSEIIEKCNSVKVESLDLVLLKIEWDGRGGEVYDHKVYPRKTALRVKELLTDKEVYFGEIWGKHSEVYGYVTERDFTLVEDKKTVQKFLDLHPLGSDNNYSFLEYLENHYEDNGGREYWEEDNGKEYCDEVEELIKIG